MANSIEKHYSSDNLLERIFAGLVMAGKNPFALTVDDLASVDEFHSRGRQSTLELAKLAAPTSACRILDIGCGLGGSARFLAERFACQVTGLDLTHDYIAAAERLSQLTGLSERCSWRVGDATELPFDNACFDLVWTEHAQMNVSDKTTFYQEIARVLKPGGRFAFHDVFAGSSTPTFPVPWAEESGISFLISEQVAKALIQSTGLHIETWVEQNEKTAAALKKNLGQPESQAVPPLGLHLLMGPNATIKLHNHLKNMQLGKITIAMGLATKCGPTEP
ncbi:MAG: methyltransferase domain-containing protein [Planctomycetaceae bacterium]|nr:methyltransferase domain-containing protein [Planctomycetaceae bacterium]